MPHQDQLPKLGPPVDLGVSVGRPLERTPTTTSIASFDAPAISVTNESTNPVTTPVTLYVKEPNTRNVKLVTTPVVTSTPVDPDDNLVIPRHPDPRVKLGYLGICDKPEEVTPSVVYGKIDGRIARIMLDSGCSTYVLSTDFANAGNILCFPCKPVPVELAVRNASQFTLATRLHTLGKALLLQGERAEAPQVKDIDEAIGLIRRLLASLLDGHPQKAIQNGDLERGLRLRSRFQ